VKLDLKDDYSHASPITFTSGRMASQREFSSHPFWAQQWPTCNSQGSWPENTCPDWEKSLPTRNGIHELENRSAPPANQGVSKAETRDGHAVCTTLRVGCTHSPPPVPPIRHCKKWHHNHVKNNMDNNVNIKIKFCSARCLRLNVLYTC